MKILGIDIGYYNLGLVLAECNGAQTEVLYLKKIDLTEFKTRDRKELSDMISLFIQTYSEIFEQAEQILVERQPPGGMTASEQLIHYIFRDKVILINPVSLHKHFNIGHLDYEERKVRTELIASKYIGEDEYYKRLDRKHDIADALCMILFQNYKNGLAMKKEGVKCLFEDFVFQGN